MCNNKDQDQGLPPPSYSESTNPQPSPSPAAAAAPPLSQAAITSHLSAQVASLPSRIRAARAAHTTRQQEEDLVLVSLLAPEVVAFLSDLGSTLASTGDRLAPSATPAELVLVPAAAVPQAWSLSGAQERRREGEIVQLARVVSAESSSLGGTKGLGGGKKGGLVAAGRVEEGREGSSRDWDTSQFDGWGRWDQFAAAEEGGLGWWWWKDEGMARRLAGYLQPEAGARAGRRATGVPVQQERKGWIWGRRKADASPAPVQKVESEARGHGDGVTMVATAEEVTFRRENEFGVWESMSGWGLVLRVRIRRP